MLQETEMDNVVAGAFLIEWPEKSQGKAKSEDAYYEMHSGDGVFSAILWFSARMMKAAAGALGGLYQRGIVAMKGAAPFERHAPNG